MRKYWLLFTQAVTVVLALLFIVQTLRPELLPHVTRNSVGTLHESVPLSTDSNVSVTGLSAAAKKAMPAVVNIFTSTVIKAPIHPLMEDPRFRFFFGLPSAFFISRIPFTRSRSASRRSFSSASRVGRN